MIIPLFIPGLQGSEIIIIAVVILILFGGRKIPEFMRGLGRGVKSFKEGVNEIKDELDDIDMDEPKKKSDKK
ncbi:MAG: twin-arginine translocase TatA/TatE family subunit [Rikenellaceae bacterium]